MISFIVGFNLSEPYKNICTIKDLSYGKSNIFCGACRAKRGRGAHLPLNA